METKKERDDTAERIIVGEIRWPGRNQRLRVDLRRFDGAFTSCGVRVMRQSRNPGEEGQWFPLADAGIALPISMLWPLRGALHQAERIAEKQEREQHQAPDALVREDTPPTLPPVPEAQDAQGAA